MPCSRPKMLARSAVLGSRKSKARPSTKRRMSVELRSVRLSFSGKQSSHGVLHEGQDDEVGSAEGLALTAECGRTALVVVAGCGDAVGGVGLLDGRVGERVLDGDGAGYDEGEGFGGVEAGLEVSVGTGLFEGGRMEAGAGVVGGGHVHGAVVGTMVAAAGGE